MAPLAGPLSVESLCARQAGHRGGAEGGEAGGERGEGEFTFHREAPSGIGISEDRG